MKISVQKLTSPDLARLACQYTMHSHATSSITLDRLYAMEHSPIRTQIFAVEMQEIPNFVSVHFVRHHVGADHYVQTMRTDRGADDVTAVRAVAVGMERDFIDVLFYTGARLSEACNLTWADVDFDRMTITLWTRKRRAGSREPRTMGMVKPLSALLYARRTANRESNHVFSDPATGRQLSKNTRWCITLLDSLCERADVTRFTAHCIRHFVATRLKDSRQATPFQIQNFLGHQNLSTTERYLHELDVDRGVSAILDDSENTNPDRIEPQIEPRTTVQ